MYMAPADLHGFTLPRYYFLCKNIKPCLRALVEEQMPVLTEYRSYNRHNPVQQEHFSIHICTEALTHDITGSGAEHH